MERLSRNNHTARAYARWVRMYRDENGDQVEAWVVQDWLEGLVAAGYSSSSVGQARAAVNKWALRLRQRGELDRDVFQAVRLEVETPKAAAGTGGRARRWLTQDELQWWLAAMGEARTATAAARNRVVALMLGTLALREREIAAAEWQDVEYRQDGQVWLRVRGKGGTYSPVVMPWVLVAALEDWRDVVAVSGGYALETAIVRQVWKSGAVGGAGVDTSTIYRMVRDAGRRAGIGQVSPHDIRATVAGLLDDDGAPMEEISRLLRHANQEVTRRYLGKRGATAGGRMADILALPNGDRPTLPALPPGENRGVVVPAMAGAPMQMMMF